MCCVVLCCAARVTEGVRETTLNCVLFMLGMPHYWLEAKRKACENCAERSAWLVHSPMPTNTGMLADNGNTQSTTDLTRPLQEPSHAARCRRIPWKAQNDPPPVADAAAQLLPQCEFQHGPGGSKSSALSAPHAQHASMQRAVFTTKRTFSERVYCFCM